MRYLTIIATDKGIEEESHDIKLKHPRQLTHGTVLDDIVHEYMVATKNHAIAAELNNIRYLNLN